MKRLHLFFLGLFSILLISEGISFFLISGREQREIERIETRIRELREEYQRLLAEKKRRLALLEATDRAYEGLERFYSLLFNEGEKTRLLSLIYSMVRTAELTVNSASYSPEIIKEEGLWRYTITFHVEGPYTRIKRFIHEIETSPHLWIIEELGLFSSKNGGEKIVLKLKLTTYISPGGGDG